MKFSDFFDLIISAFSPSDTKPDFLSKMFASAGLPLEYSESAKRKFYSGERDFSTDFKREHRQDFNTDSAASLFQELCARCDQHHVIAEIGLPESEQINTDALSLALTQQFKRIIDNDGPDVDNILSQSYRENRAKTGSGEPPAEIQPPHYPGDDFFIPTRHVSKNVGCYETIQHAWEIVNTGTQTWEGRCLYIRESDDPPPTLVRINETCIRLPKTLPRQKQKITAHLETRGKEGKSKYEWVMKDAAGNLCFPGQDCGSITIDVTFTQ